MLIEKVMRGARLAEVSCITHRLSRELRVPALPLAQGDRQMLARCAGLSCQIWRSGGSSGLLEGDRQIPARCTLAMNWLAGPTGLPPVAGQPSCVTVHVSN